MGRSCAWSETEKTQIKLISDKGFSFSVISRNIKRSRKVITTLPKLSPTTHRRVLREASRKGMSSRNLKTSFDLNVTPRRVRQILVFSKDFVYKKITTPPLTKMHEKRREKVKWNAENWSKVIFFYEKKFNLDGPDGFQFYWPDLQKIEQIFSKCPFGGRSLMIWGAFSIEGKASLVKMEGKQNAQKYTEIFKKKSPSIFGQ